MSHEKRHRQQFAQLCSLSPQCIAPPQRLPPLAGSAATRIPTLSWTPRLLAFPLTVTSTSTFTERAPKSSESITLLCPHIMTVSSTNNNILWLCSHHRAVASAKVRILFLPDVTQFETIGAAEETRSATAIKHVTVTFLISRHCPKVVWELNQIELNLKIQPKI